MSWTWDACEFMWSGFEWYARRFGVVDVQKIVVRGIEIKFEVKCVCHDIGHLTLWFKENFMIKRS